MLRRSFAGAPRDAHVAVGRAAHAGAMTLTIRDVALALAFLLAYPVAITVTDRAASEPGDPGRPPAVAEGSGP